MKLSQEKPTQFDKILAMCADGLWHCQDEFWKISRSPHKRRGDIEKGVPHGIEAGRYEFIPRPCEHGIDRSRDFRMIEHDMTPQEKKQLSMLEKTLSL